MKTDLLFLKKYKDRVEKEVLEFIQSIGEQSKLTEACSYVLTNAGKRLRPIIVMLIAEAIGKGNDVMPAALSVELFHTASLIADDLPCMDDEIERRSKPALHLAFNESTALLASYTFISAGYGLLEKNTSGLIYKNKINENIANKLCALSLKEISKVAGIHGATGGQFLDLFPPDSSAETIFKIIEQKTVSLFEISFVLGWIFGGGELSKLDKIKECAHHFGLAFQIADDINDLQQDIENGNRINIVRALGEDSAYSIFHKELDLFKIKMDQLNILTDPFVRISKLLVDSIS